MVQNEMSLLKKIKYILLTSLYSVLLTNRNICLAAFSIFITGTDSNVSRSGSNMYYVALSKLAWCRSYINLNMNYLLITLSKYGPDKILTWA